LNAAPTATPLVPGQQAGPRLHVALCTLPPGDAAHGLEQAMRHLPAALLPGILRYRRAEDRLARAAARLMLRAGLRRLGLPGAATLDGWRNDPGGRPYLEGRPVDLSISHSGRWIGIAIGQDLRVGLDLEERRPVAPRDFAHLLTPGEQAGIATAPDQAAALLQRWCLREAVLKADGAGFTLPDSAIRAIGDGHFPGGRHWETRVLARPEGCLALATDRPAATEAWHEYRWAEVLAGGAA
jgi:4'-phosphopantetheinyl transferase